MDNNSATQTILVVDDTDLNRSLVNKMLGRLGYQVLEAENGLRALECIDVHPVDLVLLDIAMPEMDGIEVLTRLRQRYSMLELPVIMVTADDHEERIVEALSLGANDYLLKPLNMAVAAARIKTQLSIVSLSKLKDDFVRFASHDLKKPMLVIADIIETVRDVHAQQVSKMEELIDYLDLIDSTNQRMQDVVHGFLDQNQMDGADTAASTAPVDLNTVIDEVKDNNTLYAEKKQTTLTTELTSSLPALNVDVFKVRQVLDNMIGNAIKFSPIGAQVHIRSTTHDREVVVEIIDNGPGLTAGDLAKLFKRGAHLSNQPTGGETSSGIGLSLCKDLIEAAGGKIGARTNPDKGSTFWFSLPV